MVNYGTINLASPSTVMKVCKQLRGMNTCLGTANEKKSSISSDKKHFQKPVKSQEIRVAGQMW